ncbi:GNAT family protein [Leisingera sp. NJS204]|uniref:GNAT family protein n=1 Tax=Leisingera sp. NJS204 TaxID=2508307 RepID=UPI001012733E|nr:GNAT family protein [Leisingera sp. NJS204]QAX31314.1 N-acetyltransferase [Leisingera sp. NJS204]
MTPVYDYPEAVKAFVAAGIFTPGRSFGPASAIGFATAEKGLVAGIVYHNFEPDAGVIEMSAFSTRRDWVSKSRLALLFQYPFEQLGCRAVVARHSEHNRRTRRIWAALGAEQTLVPDLRGPNEAEVIAVLTREAWHGSKFFEVNHGQT